jgi:hypothetical protein
MCRSIHVLHNFEPPTTPDEIEAAALQYVRKVSGMTRPSARNQAAFDRAVEVVTEATRQLLDGLVSTTPPRDRELEHRRARARWERRQAAAARPRPRNPSSRNQLDLDALGT